MLGSLILRESTYEEVERDRTALPGAMLVVVLSSLSMSVGREPFRGILPLAAGTAFAIAGWVLWAALTFFIGTRLLAQPGTRSNVGELLRTTGYAAAPGLFGLVGAAPGIGEWVVFGLSVWMMMAMVVAIRQALDFTTLWRAFAVVVTGWLVYIVVLLVLPI